MKDTTLEWTLASRMGLLRSLLIYYGVPWRQRQLVGFFRQFIAPGSLCFDVGAHVGNRLRAWHALGAHVVALEPQPHCMALLQRWYGDAENVTLLAEAVGARAGSAMLQISQRTPTVTSLSKRWISDVRRDQSFANVVWDAEIPVQVTTLDHLIQQYGCPDFCKLDVEGYELEVLQGLSIPLPALSFEMIAVTQKESLACVDRLDQLGDYTFNWTRGERHVWQSEQWLDAGAMQARIRKMETGSGDIYARLRSREVRSRDPAA